MKGDFSRYTFDKRKHYSGVLMQQGRVQVDADWNEQEAINRYRVHTRGTDVIGRCGTPREAPGFDITFLSGLDLSISKGRYYVDGILCENEEDVAYMSQPHLPDPQKIQELLKKEGAKAGLVYLHVEQRHVTALDDPYIREKALDGSDTATRLKTVWQVKVLPLPSVDIGQPGVLVRLVMVRLQLEAELLKYLPSGDNQKIREIRSDLAQVEWEMERAAPGMFCGATFKEWDSLVAPSTGLMNAHTTQPPKKKGPCVLPPLAGYQRLENQLYRVEVHKDGTRGKATFKWSRDNGSVAVAIEDVSGADITVSSVGKDEVLGFTGDQWVEIVDDFTDLHGLPGQLVQIDSVTQETNVITLKAPPTSVDKDLHPKLRRWDQTGESATANGIAMTDGWLYLEDGIEVEFEKGSYKTGDYWLIPGRAATGEIEWPPYEVPNKNPIPQPPLGINRHFCRLAIIFVDEHDGKLHRLRDCRRPFPAVTRLMSLFCLSGDGQEAMPDYADPKPILLEEPLRVGVAAGQWPAKGPRVKFEVTQGNGTLKSKGASGKTLDALVTAVDGVAECEWEVDPVTQVQRVKATLLDGTGEPAHLPVYFSARLSTASEVAYDPKDCTRLAGKYTVQDAIDQLCTTGGGGGCAISVAPTEKLTEKLDYLLKEGRGDISLCLLPGDHQVPNGYDCNFQVEGGVHLKIVGAGLGTRIHVGRRVRLAELNSLILRDVLMTSEKALDGMLVCEDCKHVEVASCSFSGTTTKGPLLEIDGADHVLLKGNILDAYRKQAVDMTVAAVASAGHGLSELFREADRLEFNAGALKIAGALSALSAAERRDTARSISTAVTELGNRLTTAEHHGYALSARYLTASTTDKGDLATAIMNIRRAAMLASPGNAIAIVDGDGEVVLADNDIAGIVTLYGRLGSSTLTGEDAKRFGALLEERVIKVKGAAGRLHMRGNQVTCVRLADTAIKRIKKILSDGKGTLEDVFEVGALTDNVIEGESCQVASYHQNVASNTIEGGQNQFIGHHLAVTSNIFTKSRVDAGWAIGDSVVILGNQAADDIKLYMMGRAKKQGLNLTISVVNA